MTGGQDEVDDVEGGQHYHHEQHAVDREVPVKISENFVVLQSNKYIISKQLKGRRKWFL